MIEGKQRRCATISVAHELLKSAVVVAAVAFCSRSNKRVPPATPKPSLVAIGSALEREELVQNVPDMEYWYLYFLTCHPCRKVENQILRSDKLGLSGSTHSICWQIRADLLTADTCT